MRKSITPTSDLAQSGAVVLLGRDRYINAMTPELFDQTLRKFIQREPFQPFVVELLDGTAIPIERPAVAFGGGVAGLLDDEQGFIGFSCEQVKDIHPLPQGIAS
jgi:hypothetical protein